MATQEAINEAKEIWGEDAVYQAMEVVAMSDADGAYSMFEDMGQLDLAEVVEFLYFDGSADD
jgi:hypothetical protein